MIKFIVLSTFLFVAGDLWSQTTKGTPRPSVGVRYQWTEGEELREAWLDEARLAEWGEDEARSTELRQRRAQLQRQQGHLRIWRLPQRNARSQMGQLRAQGHANLAAVFRTGPDESFSPQVLTGHLMVFFPTDWTLKSILDWAQRHRLEHVEALAFGKNGHRFRAPSAGAELLDLLSEIQRAGEVKLAAPEWWQDRRAR